MKSISAFVLAFAIFCIARDAGAAGPTSQIVYTNKTRFRIPYRSDSAEMQTLGAREIHLFMSSDHGLRWQKIQSVEPQSGKFDFEANSDGEYWFAVRTLDSRNQLHPSGDIVEPELKVVVDTAPPVFEISVDQSDPGKVQLRWRAEDTNLDPTKLRLEYMQSGSADWQQVSIVPQATGQTAWSVPEGGFVAVRGRISDLASNFTDAQNQVRIEPGLPKASPGGETEFRHPVAVDRPPVRPFENPVATGPSIPGNGYPAITSNGLAPGVSRPNTAPFSAKANAAPGTHAVSSPISTLPDITQPRFSKPVNAPVQAQPRADMRFVNAHSFQLGYKLDDVGPTGVQAVELFITEDDGKVWYRYGADPDKTSPFRVDVPLDGVFGFAIRVHNGAGRTEPPPQPGEKPSTTVVSDTSPPVATMQQFAATPQHQITVRWTASDPYLAERPIGLAESSNPNGPWKSIGNWMPNSGNFTWSPKPGVTYVQLTARDSAGNMTRVTSPQPVVLDTFKPTAKIVDVESTGAGQPAQQ